MRVQLSDILGLDNFPCPTEQCFGPGSMRVLLSNIPVTLPVRTGAVCALFGRRRFTSLMICVQDHAPLGASSATKSSLKVPRGVDGPRKSEKLQQQGPAALFL